MKKAAATAVLIATLLMQATVASSAPLPYTDVPADHWASGAILRMSDLGVIQGAAPGLFEPGRQVTRAEYVKLLVELGRKTGVLPVLNYFKEPVAPYTDVSKADWYYEFVVDAYNRGILENAAAFQPDQPLIREDMAYMTANFYRLVKGSSADQVGSDIPIFADMADISRERGASVLFLARSGLIGGTWNARGELVFAPKNKLTRAEAAVLTERLYDKLRNDGKPSGAGSPVLEDNGIVFTMTRHENQLIIEADMGERRTGGYSIRILGAKPGPDAVTIEYEAVFPKPGDIVTQSLTHPKDMLAVQLDPGAPAPYKLKRIE